VAIIIASYAEFCKVLRWCFSSLKCFDYINSELCSRYSELTMSSLHSHYTTQTFKLASGNQLAKNLKKLIS